MSGSGPSELGVVMRPGGHIRRPATPARSAKASLSPNATKAISSKIFIKGLSVEAECGVYSYEKGKRRPLIIDIEVSVGGNVRATNDDLSQTIDYDTLAGHIHDVAGSQHLHLIETFAEQICDKVLTDPRIETVRLRIEKPGSVPGAVCSGVEIVRAR
jgi:7,8-dihydroneopterin aldolase/epimerase/oxygenase